MAGLRAQPFRSPAPRPTLAGMASYGLSAGLGGSASRTRSTQQCSPRLFTRAEEHTQRFRLGLRGFTVRLSADSWALPRVRRSRRSASSALCSFRGVRLFIREARKQNPRRANLSGHPRLLNCVRHRRCQRTSGRTEATADCHTNHISTTRSGSSRNRRRRAKGGPESAR